MSERSALFEQMLRTYRPDFTRANKLYRRARRYRKIVGWPFLLIAVVVPLITAWGIGTKEGNIGGGIGAGIIAGIPCWVVWGIQFGLGKLFVMAAEEKNGSARSSILNSRDLSDDEKMALIQEGTEGLKYIPVDEED